MYSIAAVEPLNIEKSYYITISKLMFLICFSDSPVHIVGGSHPLLAQPSKVLNLLPRPSGTKSLVLSYMGNLEGARETPRSYPLATKSGRTPHSYCKYYSEVRVIVSEA